MASPKTHNERSDSFQSLRRVRIAMDRDLWSVYSILSNVEVMYPGFTTWYCSKVIPGTSQLIRKVFFVQREANIIGVAIAKRTYHERKLCTLWVDATARYTGVATSLAEQAFEWLGTNKPLFTVPGEQLSEFRGLLNIWDFLEADRLINHYRPGKIEHVFNGFLHPKQVSAQTRVWPADHPIRYA